MTAQQAAGQVPDDADPTAHHDVERQTYDVEATQEKWLKVWQRLDPFKALDDGSRERRYLLDMFTYPSGDLHMGHAEVFALADVIARYWFQQGYDVLHPIGWDSFGLPAENAAIKRGEHPAEWTYRNIETQAESFRRYAISVDWSTRMHTSDPEYYKWTQWLFLKLYDAGLAYRKASAVNWCPNDQTVLANEQVVGGRCERCGAEVTKRNLTQWYFKVTDFVQRLLDDMDALQGNWPERVLAMQRNWIGRSEGAHVNFVIGGDPATGEGGRAVTVFTTRPDTLFGATFFVIAADSPLAAEVWSPGPRPGVRERTATEVRRTTEIERVDRGSREDRGVPGRLRGQPPQRGADACLCSRLRAGRLRHRRHHGRPGAGPARLGLRDEVRPADRPDSAALGRLRGRRLHR